MRLMWLPIDLAVTTEVVDGIAAPPAAAMLREVLIERQVVPAFGKVCPIR